MKYFRTKNGFIFKGEAEIGKKFTYDTNFAYQVEDEVECIGNTLKDLVKKGDLVEYDFENQKEHGVWLLMLETERSVDELKKRYSSSVKKIFIKWGFTYVESIVLPQKALKLPVLILGLTYDSLQNFEKDNKQ